MRQQLTGFRNRLLSAVAIGLCIVLVAVVASTLKPSISATVAPEPPKSAPTSGISLIALLYQLINAVLAIFGISIDPPSSQFSGGSILGFVFALLKTIYQHRLAIITSVVHLIVLVLLYQYRHRLAVTRVLRSPDETAETAAQSSTTDVVSNSWPPEPDPDSVQEAWIAMVRRVHDGVETPSSRTPTEWQAIAIAAGLPTEAVKTITTTFRAIQYGSTTETDVHRDRVQAALADLETHQEATNE